MSEPLLGVRGVRKRFGAVQALDGVDLELRAGEIHAVLGENGAGKSTLMHVLDGVYRPDSGDILLDGRVVRFSSPRAARRAGIGMVHQHFALVDALSVEENLALSLSPPPAWRLDRQEVRNAAQKLAAEVGLDLPPPSTLVRDLPVGARQRLEVLKALAGAGRVLILDEPTAVLTPQEVGQLFTMLRRLRGQGRLIILITHKLSEVLEVADRVTVMRHGRVAGTWNTNAVSATDLAEKMIGTPASLHDPTTPRSQALKPSSPQAPPALAIDNLSLRDDGVAQLDQIHLVVQRGEILGIAGVDGNGQRELFDVLAGSRAAQEGTIRVGDMELNDFTPAAALASGIGLIPPDRHREGLVLGMSVAENLLLHRRALQRFSRHGLLQRDAAWRHVQELVQRYRIQCAGLDLPVRDLSGGNQQRIIVARELAEQPTVLVTVNPTRGLDFAATRAVADALREVAANGCGVLLISTDLDEVLDLADRVAVLYRGRLSPTLSRPVDTERLGSWMAGIDPP